MDRPHIKEALLANIAHRKAKKYVPEAVEKKTEDKPAYLKCKTKDKLVAWIKANGLDKEFDLRQGYNHLLDAVKAYYKKEKKND